MAYSVVQAEGLARSREGAPTFNGQRYSTLASVEKIYQVKQANGNVVAQAVTLMHNGGRLGVQCLCKPKVSPVGPQADWRWK